MRDDETDVSRSPLKMTYDEWAALGLTIQSAAESVMWWVGDWWLHGERAYGEAASQAAPSGLASETLRKTGWVCWAFRQSVRRRTDLTFMHHVTDDGRTYANVHRLFDVFNNRCFQGTVFVVARLGELACRVRQVLVNARVGERGHCPFWRVRLRPARRIASRELARASLRQPHRRPLLGYHLPASASVGTVFSGGSDFDPPVDRTMGWLRVPFASPTVARCSAIICPTRRSARRRARAASPAALSAVVRASGADRQGAEPVG